MKGLIAANEVPVDLTPYLVREVDAGHPVLTSKEWMAFGRGSGLCISRYFVYSEPGSLVIHAFLGHAGVLLFAELDVEQGECRVDRSQTIYVH